MIVMTSYIKYIIYLTKIMFENDNNDVISVNK